MTHVQSCEACGTISEGTLRPETLIPAFVSALATRLDELAAEQRRRRRSVSPQVEQALEDLDNVELRMEQAGYYESSDSDEDLEWLQEQLSLYAPIGHWFGTHPGDAADFGFWPVDDDGDEGGAGGPEPDLAAAPSARSFPALADTHVETWFERDRAHVALYSTGTNDLIAEWWDGDVSEAIEDGFLDPRDYHRSAYDYARELAGAGQG